MWLKSLALVLVAFAVISTEASKDRNQKPYKVVCYLGSWANYRQGEGKFLIEDIDPFLCTHLIYGFAKLQNNQIAPYDPYLDLKENWGLGAYERFNGLKKKNPQLSTIIAIGGWNEGSTKYSAMASNAASRATFIQSCLDFMAKYDFDGLDMDWEYPANRGGAPEDKQNFILLLKELKEAFAKDGYLLTAAVAAGEATMETAYDIKSMGIYLSFINVMAYDFHGSWEKVTGHNAPLYSRPEESEFEKKLNVDHAINYWIKNGAPPKKLVLGMGLYGRSFTLANAGTNGIGAPTTGPGAAGPITREGGMLGYNEICKDVRNGWTEVWAEKIDSPYAYNDRQWVGYDNERSIALKVDYLKEKNLGGGMVWSLETDDFKGYCGGGNYPLLTVIDKKLNGDAPNIITHEPGKTTEKPEIITNPPHKTTTEPDNGGDGDEVEVKEEDGTYIPCEWGKPGRIKHPNDCEKFAVCDENSGYKLYKCGGGKAFSESKKKCVPRSESGC